MYEILEYTSVQHTISTLKYRDKNFKFRPQLM